MTDLLQPHAMVDLLYHLHIKFKKYMFDSHESPRLEFKICCALYRDVFLCNLYKSNQNIERKVGVKYRFLK